MAQSYGYNQNVYQLREGKLIQRLPYFLGLDLGQSVDPSALAILERHGSGPQAVFP